MDTSRIRLLLPEFSSIKSYGLDVQIDSPFFYVTDGAIPFIYKGKVADWSASRVLFDSAYFLDIIALNGSGFVTRSYSNRAGRALLTRISTEEPKLTLHPEILEKQVDGLFCTDGMLHYDKTSDLLVYLYYYRNQFIVMDSLLNIHYRGNTIDTFRVAQVEIKSLSRSGHTSRRLSGPPPYVNKNSATSAGKLFVHSMVAAKNEDMNEFRDASVIDVYDLLSGEYRFSFYIYHRDGEKIKSFHVTDYHLYAIYDHYITKYRLHPSRFKRAGHQEILSIKSGMKAENL